MSLSYCLNALTTSSVYALAPTCLTGSVAFSRAAVVTLAVDGTYYRERYSDDFEDVDVLGVSVGGRLRPGNGALFVNLLLGLRHEVRYSETMLGVVGGVGKDFPLSRTLALRVAADAQFFVSGGTLVGLRLSIGLRL